MRQPLLPGSVKGFTQVRGLIGRHLGPFAYHQIRRQLDALEVMVDEIFLLHEAFYDIYGRALHPLTDLGLAG